VVSDLRSPGTSLPNPAPSQPRSSILTPPEPGPLETSVSPTKRFFRGQILALSTHVSHPLTPRVYCPHNISYNLTAPPSPLKYSSSVFLMPHPRLQRGQNLEFYPRQTKHELNQGPYGSVLQPKENPLHPISCNPYAHQHFLQTRTIYPDPNASSTSNRFPFAEPCFTDEWWVKGRLPNM